MYVDMQFTKFIFSCFKVSGIWQILLEGLLAQENDHICNIS